MTAPLSTLTLFAADAVESTSHAVSNLSSATHNAIGTKAAQTAQSGIFPVETAFIVLGCLLVTGFVLLLRESQIERRHR